jgi:hypothetical protein
MNDVSAPAFEGATDAPTDSDLAQVAWLAQEQARAEDKVARLTAELQAAIGALRQISDRDLPDAMLRCGLRSYALADGRKVGVGDKYVAGKVATRDGLAWVRGRGEGELVKTTVSVEFPPGHAEDATDLVALVKRQRYANAINRIEVEDAVHNSTASAMLNRLAEDGQAIMPEDLEALGAYRLRRAKVGDGRYQEVKIKGLKAKGRNGDEDNR